MSRERVIQQIIKEYDTEVNDLILLMENCKSDVRRNELATEISIKINDMESLYKHLERIKKAS